MNADHGRPLWCLRPGQKRARLLYRVRRGSHACACAHAQAMHTLYSVIYTPACISSLVVLLYARKSLLVIAHKKGSVLERKISRKTTRKIYVCAASTRIHLRFSTAICAELLCPYKTQSQAQMHIISRALQVLHSLAEGLGANPPPLQESVFARWSRGREGINAGKQYCTCPAA